MVNTSIYTQDLDFCEYASRRMNAVLRSNNHPANALDKEYESIYKRSLKDKRHRAVYIPYMTFKLNDALLMKDQRKRKNQLWWIWKKLVFDHTFLCGMQSSEDGLTNRTYNAILEMLYAEYKLKSQKKEC